MKKYRLKDGLDFTVIPGVGAVKPGQTLEGDFDRFCPNKLVPIADAPAPRPKPKAPKPAPKPEPVKEELEREVEAAEKELEERTAQVPGDADLNVVGNGSFEHPEANDAAERETEPDKPVKRKRGRPKKKKVSE